jgi:hypothetical protein
MTLKHHYLERNNPMTFTIHRGAAEIGDSCTVAIDNDEKIAYC